jgi:UDP-N-acetylglucosamine--N-acetylmuramyl-(pentapeptide) pyrophosphoryl-undecaprenol N-acetylglucosamine transferase
MEADLVRRADIPYTPIQGAGVVGVGAFKALVGILRLAMGFLQAIGVVLRFRPHALFVTGGYTAVAVTLACWLLRVPIAVYLPDVEPGSGVRFVARFASLVMVTLADSCKYFAGKRVVVTGYPLRPEILAATHQSPQQARAHFGLHPDKQTLFVFGGSRGARSLNQALLSHAEALVQQAGVQLLHISGTLDWDVVQHAHQALPKAVQTAYFVAPYLHAEMGSAFAAADLVVARAGASTLGELPAFGLPAILVPYPHAWRYQKVNADALAQAGAAIVQPDEQLQANLYDLVYALVQEPARLASMHQAARNLAQPAAAERMAQTLAHLMTAGSIGKKP